MPVITARPAHSDIAAERALAVVPPDDVPSDDALLSWRVVSLVWLLPAVADVAGMYFGARVSGTPAPFWRTVAHALPIWTVWVPLTAAIFWLAHHAPIWRTRPATVVHFDAASGERVGGTTPPRVLSWGGVATHAGASLAAALVQALVITTVSVIARDQAGTLGAWRAHLTMAVQDWLPISLLLYWMTLGAATAIERMREAREQERRATALEGRLARAELAVLRSQLEPHFLFNALNTAVSLVRAGEPAAGVDVLTRLADVLRHLLDGVAQETPLADELRLLDGYLGIARARFGARLTVTLDVPSSLDDAVVPGLALQPLVENALRHGVGRREGPGQVWVDAWTCAPNGSRVAVPSAHDADIGDHTMLYLRVRDDGPGLAGAGGPTEGTGVGLRNLRDRLERLYGASRAGLTLRDREGGGAEATVWLPLRRASGEPGAEPRAEPRARRAFGENSPAEPLAGRG